MSTNEERRLLVTMFYEEGTKSIHSNITRVIREGEFFSIAKSSTSYTLVRASRVNKIIVEEISGR